MAFALYYLKKYPQAAEAAEEALKLDANHVDARYFLALSCHRIGQKEKALEHYNKLKEIDPKKADQLKAEMDKGK